MKKSQSQKTPATSTNKASLTEKLQKQRQELLDLGTRNRLIHMPLENKNAKLVQIFDEKTTEVFRILVDDNKKMSFIPRKHHEELTTDSNINNDEDTKIYLPLPKDEDNQGTAKRHTDSKLQTKLTADKLQRRLFTLYNEAREVIEEQGINTLYLSVGILNYIDTDKKKRTAPLVLIPVKLSRKTAKDKFELEWLEEEIASNLSIIEKLKIDHNIILPKLGNSENIDIESNDIIKYLNKVITVVSNQKEWLVDVNGMCLGMFSFAKYLMFKDLDPSSWPEEKSILDNPMVKQLVAGTDEGLSIASTSGLTNWSDIKNLDDHISVEQLDHIVDADSSQTVAIQMVREGRNLVIQGPPGTGKSQTITNIIATAVLDGKKVLFLAEKLAALEVVYRRLAKEGLDCICLELHSSKVKKTDVIQEINKTWQLGRPAPSKFSESNIEKLKDLRVYLNNHPKNLHQESNSISETPYYHIGKLTHLGQGDKKWDWLNIAGVETWSNRKMENAKELVVSYGKALMDIKDPKNHIWKDSNIVNYIGTERNKIEHILTNWLEATKKLTDVSKYIEDSLGKQFTIDNITQLKIGIKTLNLVNQKPQVAISTTNKTLWDDQRDFLKEAIRCRNTYTETISTSAEKFTASAWSAELSNERRIVMTEGKSWFKRHFGQYKKAKNKIQTYYLEELPKDPNDILKIADILVKGQDAFRGFEKYKSLGENAFGPSWSLSSFSTNYQGVIDWLINVETATGRKNIMEWLWSLDIRYTAAAVRDALLLIEDERKNRELLIDELKLPDNLGFESENLEMVSIAKLHSKAKEYISNIDSLPIWFIYRTKRNDMISYGLQELVKFAEETPEIAKDLIKVMEIKRSKQAVEAAFKNNIQLSTFTKYDHEEKIKSFKKLDQQRKDIAKEKILITHYDNFPPKLPSGQPGIILEEYSRRRPKRSVRNLICDAGAAIQDIKPVLMMSPLSVAQFLEPGKVEFDLLVIDEASQIKPIEALGAIARCKQVVVVGDNKQLPPTSFFSKITSDSADDYDDGDSAQLGEFESILTLFKARAIPDTMLRWHYRSKHPSLIAISNKQYYDSKLFLVPSPVQMGGTDGVVFRYVNGIYDRGGSGTNKIEAEAVANAVIHHARHQPNLSLLVAAFSQTQQMAIMDLVEVMRNQNSDVEAFFNSHPSEPFTVKNLENVQGDERDVVFLSIGYGKDAEGKMYQNFGPLNKIGGERRLNVLISRAKIRCEVFASITDEDIKTSNTEAVAVKDLKAYLNYARTGTMHLATNTGRTADSPFETAVAEMVRTQLKLEVEHQVGQSGFFIDLAIVDPKYPGRYILGIECDGASYHSSPSARERDRLRQEILESKGWNIIRIWSLDFFKNPKDEINRIKTAYEQALKNGDKKGQAKTNADTSTFTTIREAVIEPPKFDKVKPYVMSKVIFDEDTYLSAMSLEDESKILAIIRIESPIHRTEIVRRVRDGLNKGKAGRKIDSWVQDGIMNLKDTQQITISNDFCFYSDTPLVIRDRNVANFPAESKKTELISNEELDLALVEYTKAVISISETSLSRDIVNLFGFKSNTQAWSARISARLVVLCKLNKLKRDGDSISAQA